MEFREILEKAKEYCWEEDCCNCPAATGVVTRNCGFQGSPELMFWDIDTFVTVIEKMAAMENG